MSIPITDKFKPSGVGGFALMDAVDIEHNGVRLSDIWPVELSQAAYNELEATGKLNPNTFYVITAGDGE